MDHFQLAVFLSMAGAFLMGMLVKAAWVGATCYAQGQRDARLDTAQELTAALNDPALLRAGGAI